jgi:hypothetical protein
MERLKDTHADPNGKQECIECVVMNINVIRHMPIHVYANPHSLYHQYSLLSSGFEGFDKHANKSELKALPSLHVCVKIHIDLALLKKQI